jgi:hypothetical protein
MFILVYDRFHAHYNVSNAKIFLSKTLICLNVATISLKHHVTLELTNINTISKYT